MKKILAETQTALSMAMTFALVVLLFWSLARLFFMTLLYDDRVEASGHFVFFTIQGLRFDLIPLGILLLPMAIAPIAALKKGVWQLFQKCMLIYFTLLFSLIVLMELVTPAFIEQFDIRPNILFVEYLKYPKEVFATLGKGYWPQLLLAAIVVPASAFGLERLLYRRFQSVRIRWQTALVLTPVIFLLCLLMVRSTLGHRPANPSKLAVSNDLMVNSLGLNSLYSALYALYYSTNDDGGQLRYGSMPKEQVLSIVREQMHKDPSDFISSTIPTLHFQKALISRTKPLNLVILLEESLGAEFVGRLGGLPLTPNLDALADEGFWFEQLYATGTRSVRGIEAVITGFTPTPTHSVVKLQKSQKDFFTIAELLRRQNYETSFFYGGEAHFDNMRSFFMGNGFTKIVEQKDFEKPEYIGTWGVSDGDLFNKAHEYFNSRNDSQPFFSLVFSSSNHTPFEYPEGKIVPYDKESATVNNAVKYADYAIGEFFKKAKLSKYWQNTVFLVVADHNSRVYGADLVPIDRFHIPGLILGADIQPRSYAKVASQIDLVPTLLSMLGISDLHPAIGHDLLREDLANVPGRAMMQYNDVQAYMLDSQVVVLQTGKEPEQYEYRDKKLHPISERDPVFVDAAIAHSLFGQIAYDNGLYRLLEDEHMETVDAR
jgi:phosphoglycerol transferase MdoB-like AlkP superfamily enzyme